MLNAVRQAVSSPLLETNIEGATGLILNVMGGKDMTLGEVSDAATLVQNVLDPSANIIFGAGNNGNTKGEVTVTIIATGFKSKNKKDTILAEGKLSPLDVENAESEMMGKFISGENEEKIEPIIERQTERFEDEIKPSRMEVEETKKASPFARFFRKNK